MKRAVQPSQMPSIDVDGYGMQQIYVEHEDDSPSRKKKQAESSPGCLAYIVLIFLLFSGLYGMAALSGGSPSVDAAAAAARKRFQTFQVPGSSSTSNFVSEQLPHHSSVIVEDKPLAPAIAIPVAKATAITTTATLQLEIIELYRQVKEQEDKVRSMKQKGIVMETDPEALIETAKLQELCRRYVPLKYGPGPYYLKFDVVFPDTMPDLSTAGKEGSFIVQMGPVEKVPYSVFFFLEIVGSKWKGGAFHRPAHHVLQALVRASSKPLAFQEYSPQFPHLQYTLGYAGRPGGPEFYVSTVDNSQNHGPGSQGSKTEADGCWGRLAGGDASLRTIKRIQRQPGGRPPSMFVGEKDYIRIPSVTLINNPTLEQQEIVFGSTKKLREVPFHYLILHKMYRAEALFHEQMARVIILPRMIYSHLVHESSGIET